MNLKNISLLIFCICGNIIYAQNIQGIIRSQAGQPIANTNLSILNSSTQTISDKDGHFLLDLKIGKYELECDAVGFAKKIEVIDVKKDNVLVEIILKDNTKVLDEVVVTGTNKIETNLQKTPAAVSVLSAQKLKEYRAWNVADLTALAPSLMVMEHGNSSGSNFFNIRGTMGFTNEQAVATYVDGVYQFDYYSSPINFNNIERIEVLRGPQGTLYGRNAFSGVINIITKKPTNTTSGFAELDFGNYNQQRYTLGINTPIIKDKLYFNISGQFTGRGSVYSNPTLNTNNFDNHKSFNLNGNLKYVINDKWLIILNAKTEDNKDRGAYPWTSTYEEAWANEYTTFVNWDNTERRSNTNVSATANYFGERFNFTSISSGIAYHIWIPNRFDYDFTAANLMSGKNSTKSKQFTQEFRFSSPANADNLKWTVGSYFFKEKIKTNTDTYYDEDYVLLDPSAPYTTLTDSQRRNWGAALFGQASYSISPKLDITAGIRYDIERKKQNETNNLLKDNVLTAVTRLESDIKTFKAFTPKIVLSYKLDVNSLVYASFAKGFRVGGFNIGTNAINYRIYNPEKSDNYELAIKNNFFQNKLKLNITAFYLQQKDQQVGTSTDGVNYLTLNVGDMNNFGIETEIAVLPAKNLSIEWNAAWSDAKYAKLELYDNITSTIINYKDNYPINNPNLSSMIATQYNFPLKISKQNISLFLRGEYRYIGKYYLDFINNYNQEGYGIFNARAGIKAKNYEIAVWCRNLNDKRYISWGYGSYILGSPRMYGLTMTGKF